MKTTIFSHHRKNVKSHIHAGVMQEFSLTFVHYIDKNCFTFRRMVSLSFGSTGVQLKSGPYFNMSNLFTNIYNMLYYTTNLYLQ